MYLFRNMKISITDETHLKAVCDVLESMGYVFFAECSSPNFVVTHEDGFYQMIIFPIASIATFDVVTLTDLLKMRDEMVKEKINERA